MSDSNAHAIANAKAWLETIRDLVARMNAAEEDSEEREAIEQEIDEGPLSVQVRSGWYAPGADPADVMREPCEFEVLLSTGGPALRIVGDLGAYCQPERPRLQWQDWGTPWTDHETTVEDDEAIQAYVSRFYYGEG